ncbi:MAG: hypothetical protein CSA75_02830, partial [Sorangium cellulosum]
METTSLGGHWSTLTLGGIQPLFQGCEEEKRERLERAEIGSEGSSAEEESQESKEGKGEQCRSSGAAPLSPNLGT